MRKLKKILGIPISFLTLFLCMFPALKASAIVPPATSVYLPVYALHQDTLDTCWATAAAMAACFYHKDTVDREDDVVLATNGKDGPSANIYDIVNGILYTAGYVYHNPAISPYAPGDSGAPSPYNYAPKKYSPEVLSNEMNKYENIFIVRLNEARLHAVTLKGYENWSPNYNIVYNDPYTGDEQKKAWSLFSGNYYDTVASCKIQTPYN